MLALEADEEVVGVALTNQGWSGGKGEGRSVGDQTTAYFFHDTLKNL